MNLAPWVRRWNHSRPRWMSRGHYEAIGRMAEEVESRTPFLVSIDHQTCQLHVGPANSPWSVWSTTLFDSAGRARTFTRWRDGIGTDDVVRLAMLSQQSGKKKARWARRKKPKGEAAEARWEQTRVESRRCFENVMRRRVYGLA